MRTGIVREALTEDEGNVVRQDWRTLAVSETGPPPEMRTRDRNLGRMLWVQIGVDSKYTR